MIDPSSLEIWFVTGSQHLYGAETLEQVGAHAREIADSLSKSSALAVKVICKPVMTTSDTIHQLCLDANQSSNCIGLVAWMHTFSPAQNWIKGLLALKKPLAHLHTQYNHDLPWSTIDMDFMNLNQAAHGDREFGFIGARLRLNRKVIFGFWQDEATLGELATWTRAACAWHDWQQLKVARFGDNMRRVAVTEGDKVEANIQFGFSVDGYGIGDLVAHMDKVSDADVQPLATMYDSSYHVVEPLRAGGQQRQSLLEAARIELGLRRFLDEGGFGAFTDTFQILHGLPQLPGVAVQRLMADGFGFGAEGDWKTSALVRAMKVMGHGLPKGTSFMEDYTYHMQGAGQVLGSHMLEVCPSIAAEKPTLEIHPLSIGDKADPVRLVFTSRIGPAVVASLVDMGGRFRMVANKVQVLQPEQPLPKLPVARAIWKPEPDLKTAAVSWILAGGAHHTGFSLDLTSEHLRDFAEMAGIEFLLIDEATTVPQFKKELQWNDVYYRIAKGF